MAVETRSKAAAATPPQATPIPQQATVTQDDSVAVNWVFFDASRPNNRPLPIDVPSTLFSGRSQDCMSLFITPMLNEFRFEVDETTITFWMPKELLLADTVGESEPGWTESIDEKKFRDSFKLVALTEPLEGALRGLDNEDAVHLVVTAEGTHHTGDVATALPEIRRYYEAISAPGLSSGEADFIDYIRIQRDPGQAIHDGQYPPNPQFATVAPPVQIFHSIFEEFIQFIDDPSVQPTHNDLTDVQDLIHSLSRIDAYDLDYRNPKIRKHLTKILGVRVADQSTDGVHLNGIDVPFFIFQCKLEFGEAGYDASLQAGMTMRRSWIQRDRAGIRDKCCCPTLILVSGGAWMGVLGGVFTDKVILQRLTDMMWVGHSSTEEDPRVYRTARVLVALRMCINKLRTYYESLETVKGFSFPSCEPRARFYPHPTSFTENSTVFRFQYVRMLEDDAACVTYQAEILDPVVSDSSRYIVVKFVTRYSEEVHKFLAAQGHAPELRYCGPLGAHPSQDPPRGDKSPQPRSPLDSPNRPREMSLGPLKMIVMDYIETCPTPPRNARDQLGAILRELHSAGYVLGDLRRQNVLFDRDGKAKIIDLDWAGCYDMKVRDGTVPEGLQEEIDKNKDQQGDGVYYVRYPLNLSAVMKEVDGVRDLKPIRPQHDWSTLAKMSLDE